MTELLLAVNFEVTSWGFFITCPEDLEVIDGRLERPKKTFSSKTPERGEDLISRELTLADGYPKLTMLSS